MSKISKICSIFYRTRNLMTSSVYLQLYYGLVYPYLYYGILAWGAAANSIMLPLFRCQKNLIRNMTHSDFRAHTTPLFRQLKLLKLSEIKFLEYVKFVHN